MSGAAPERFELELTQAVERFVYDPLGFTYFAYPWGEPGTPLEEHTGPDAWQEDQLGLLGERLFFDPGEPIFDATASGHGVGKSAQTSWVINWAMSTRPHLNGVVTANTGPQLDTKTWRELAVWHKRLINAHWFKWTATRFFHVEHPETWYVAALKNNEHNAESFAGLHAKYVLVLYDEASAIPDPIWEVTMGAMTTPGAIWLVYGNPTRNSGQFRECFRDGGLWHTRQIDSRTCRMTNKKLIARWIEMYGEDSDFVRIRVRGIFPRAASNQFISAEPVKQAMERVLDPRRFSPYTNILGVDVARFGDNESVIARRQGPKVHPLKAWVGLTPLELATKVADEARALKLAQPHTPVRICVDETGLGTGCVDRLRELRDQGQLDAEIVGVLVGVPATNARAYLNVRAELWGQMRDGLTRPDADLPHDPVLERQLVAMEYGLTPRHNQIQLANKDDLEESPDRADAVALTYAETAETRRVKPAQPRTPAASALGWAA